jgi:hypothetical protein
MVLREALLGVTKKEDCKNERIAANRLLIPWVGGNGPVWFGFTECRVLRADASRVVEWTQQIPSNSGDP